MEHLIVPQRLIVGMEEQVRVPLDHAWDEGGPWKIDHWTFLLASQPFGRFERYLPSGGMLL